MLLKRPHFYFKTKLFCVFTAFPASRRCHSCVQLHEMAYICGGYNGDVIHGDLWKINLKSLQWTKLGIMPEPVYFHSAAVTTVSGDPADQVLKLCDKNNCFFCF